MKKKQYKIVDCHQHVDFHGYDVDKLIRHMDDLGVEKAWLHSWENIDGGFNPCYSHLSVESVWHAYKKYPGRFVPFYAPDPRRADAEEKLKKWYDKGIRGFGEHKVHIKIDNPDSVRLYKLCGEMKLPVLFHVDVPPDSFRGMWYNADIDDLERVLKECKKTVFIAHGPGWWRYISKDEHLCRDQGYPEGKVKKGGKAPRLLDRYPNLYADISAGSGYRALTRDKDFGIRFVEKYRKKLLYGTDFHDRKHLDFLLDTGFSDTVLKAILSGNADRILKRSARKG